MLAVIFLAVVIGLIIYFSIHTSKDHWSPQTGETLKSNAKITGFDTKRYNKYKFKTIVTFSDGFEYISFDTRSEFAGIGTTKIIVDTEMKNSIIKKLF